MNPQQTIHMLDPTLAGQQYLASVLARRIKNERQ